MEISIFYNGCLFIVLMPIIIHDKGSKNCFDEL